jgi:hypothetical protein
MNSPVDLFWEVINQCSLLASQVLLSPRSLLGLSMDCFLCFFLEFYSRLHPSSPQWIPLSLSLLNSPPSLVWFYQDRVSSLSIPRLFDFPFPLRFWCIPSRTTLYRCRLPTHRMENMHNSLKASRNTNSLEYVTGKGHQDLEKECSGCQRMKIHLGEISSTMTFELETLSQHLSPY